MKDVWMVARWSGAVVVAALALGAGRLAAADFRNGERANLVVGQVDFDGGHGQAGGALGFRGAVDVAVETDADRIRDAFAAVAPLNAWLEERCIAQWREIQHGVLPGTIAEVHAEEELRSPRATS